ncbi:MAG TPA: methylmalonyl-CoA mutase family protein [Oceanipulchritudo sp.]|nr:methylmalonyl-CoA mutase family protein [Oceanipulchritudo sp.]
MRQFACRAIRPRRIARNTHAILAEECGMRRVIDPAGGSWAVEALTDQMASGAWKRFQEIEAAGGIQAALQSGLIQQSVETVREEKARNIQRRRDVIVGTNSYPNATEELLRPATIDYASASNQRIDTIAKWKSSRDTASVEAACGKVLTATEPVEALIAAAKSGATIKELMAALAPGIGPSIAPIPLMRASGDYEKLRFAAKELESAGTPPLLHQLNMGPSRRYRIRADWTSAFFQVGGLQVMNQDDFPDAAEALRGLEKSGARVAVIVSDDEAYATVVEPLARAIKATDSHIKVLLAGAPGDNEQALRDAGVDDFVHVRVNNYAFNRALLESMGAKL